MIMIALESGETVNRMSLVRFYLCKITLISDSCGERIDNGIQNIRIKLRDVFYFYLHNDQERMNGVVFRFTAELRATLKPTIITHFKY